jgi:ATP-binding cassette subfamily B (MDR/TAP) protein 1
VLDRVPKVRNEAPGVQLPNLRGNFSFQDVEFEYPAKRGVAILKKISFEIEAGKKTALVGESGSGKSTCLHLLERFYDVEKGKLLIDGVEIKKVDLDWLRDNIGYVGQEPVLFASSIRENLLFGKNDATEEEMWDALDKANAKKFVMGLEKKLDTFVGTSGSQMSGGQKQRICIARAILKNPKILLLDEATSALDRANELSI